MINHLVRTWCEIFLVDHVALQYLDVSNHSVQIAWINTINHTESLQWLNWNSWIAWHSYFIWISVLLPYFQTIYFAIIKSEVCFTPFKKSRNLLWDGWMHISIVVLALGMAGNVPGTVPLPRRMYTNILPWLPEKAPGTCYTSRGCYT